MSGDRLLFPALQGCEVTFFVLIYLFLVHGWSKMQYLLNDSKTVLGLFY